VLVSHSMGNLVARHYLEVARGLARHPRSSPSAPLQRSLNALDFLCNGFKEGSARSDLT
jgi:hypothetical protein